ncbi:glycosyl hydrolase 115 family protein [Streptomyces sp. MAR4 CNX-425]|uniref:glycosyl hydrolase 115 family protein n=1 Tax=Streptomyces sp. MAR4 CNX-425 TaxID=3406343 RepID=UPI003B50E94D
MESNDPRHDPSSASDPASGPAPDDGPSRRRVLGAGLGLGALSATAAGGGVLALPDPAAAAPHPDAPRPTDPGAYIAHTPGRGRFPLVAGGRAAPLVADAGDFPGVLRALGDLRTDLERVTGVRPGLTRGRPPAGRLAVLVGTIGRSPLIDGLVAAGKLDVTGIEGRWETSLHQVVDDPLPGLDRAFVIAGSDQRGTIFGIYDVSRGIGVSPWHFWADVPPRRHRALYVLPGRFSQGTPAVKYRGIFINDENPALGRWAPGFFGPGHAEGHPGGFNSAFFAKVFEAMLRLKANYLWPAVWGRAFAEDDPANHATATEYGIVMGTSHEAPMMRGIEEWNRHAVPAERDEDGNIVTEGHDPYGGTGEWSFVRNEDAIRAYWRDGIRRMAADGFEGVVTLGMRGNGDTSLPDGDGIELMRRIITAERDILAEELGDAAGVPQVWTMYKEVQHYWDSGMRAPDDVTVVFTDDNWGNLRRVPDASLPPRSGGYGLYYHFDYVGGGRNYKWVDTANLANTWEQLHQTYAYGIRQLWVANVGDLKSNELPTQYFLDYAWDPDRWPVENLPEWERRFAAENFGPRHAHRIAEVLHRYGRLQARRKPELLNRRITLDPARDPATDPEAVVYDDEATPFSRVNYHELDRVTDEWQELARTADRIEARLDRADRAAYFQLVRYAVRGTAVVYALRRAEFTNLLYAAQGRAGANQLAAETDALFAEDQALADYYNHTLSGGKWKGFQTQPKIGYGDVERYGPNAPWQQPEKNNEALPDEVFPAVRRIDPAPGAVLGVAVEGSEEWWPDAAGPAVLPAVSPYDSGPAPYIEVFNRGRSPFGYAIEPAVPWLRVDRPRGRVTNQVRARLRVDFARAPRGTTTVPVLVTGAGRTVEVHARVHRPSVRHSALAGAVEAGGCVSVEADRHSRAVAAGGVAWRRIPGIGRTGGGMAPVPVTAAPVPAGEGPRLEYTMTLFTTGTLRVAAYLSPRNSVLTTDGLRYAVAFDDDAPQTVNVTRATGADDGLMNRQWERNTSDNAAVTVTGHRVTRPGVHVLKLWMVDPTVVVQKLVVDTGGVRHSYLGPPPSVYVGR